MLRDRANRGHRLQRRRAFVALAGTLMLSPGMALSDEPAKGAPSPPSAAAAAGQIADIFSQIGDQIYEECIFELSPEQVEVQRALVDAYMQQGASGAAARRLAAAQIKPPKLSAKCEAIRHSPEAQASTWATNIDVPEKAAPEPPVAEPAAPEKPAPEKPASGKAAAAKPAPAKKAAVAAAKPASIPPPVVAIAERKALAVWDCDPNVDFVTIHLNGFERKLTGGEICKPFEDVVNEVPSTLPAFKLGYTIRSGRLFIIAEGSDANGRTIAWGLSGRDVCRNDPAPECFAAKTVGPLPPGQYTFADKDHRISWGPRTKRNVAAIYLRKLWNKDKFTAQQTAAILSRGNIAIHMRLKGEMSEACIGLEPKGWAYVASLIKDGRATSLDVFIDEPHPQIAENPPVVVASSFSLSSLFK